VFIGFLTIKFVFCLLDYAKGQSKTYLTYKKPVINRRKGNADETLYQLFFVKIFIEVKLKVC